MSGNDIVRLWKDPDGERDAAHPVGEIALDDPHGGYHSTIMTFSFLMWPGCGGGTFEFFCPDPDPFPPLTVVQR